ncbi:hypothetical protein Tco_0973899 [Tanacetum coccineum]|uniref:Uncharacterized protein n=1 Tax=Tanacetum coccineum TaxID=301880 RepID=A0ABQ5EAZ9_9ASTR
MSRINSQAEIVFEEHLVPRANRLVTRKNNQPVASDSHITDTMLRFVIEILRQHKLVSMPPPDPNNTYTKPPSENQILRFIKTLGYDEDPKTKMIAISKMFATRLHQPWRAILSVLKRSLTRKDSSWDIVRLPILHDTLGGDYKFGMEIPDRMISDAIKKLAGYKFYMAKKVESENAKIVDEPEEQHASLVKSGRGKGFMCYGDQVANVPTSLNIDVVPRKTRSQTIAEETVVGELANSISIQEPRSQQRQRSQLTIDRQTDKAVTDMYNEWGQKLKGLAVDDLAVLSLLDLQKGSKASILESLKQTKQAVAGEGSSAAHNKYYDSLDTDSDAILHSSSSDKTEESANETDVADESDMDLSDDNPNRDDAATGYGVFMHNKSTATPNSTYLRPTVTSFSLDFIQTLLDETPVNELTDFMSHPVYTNAQTTSVEMFPNKKAHHLSSLPATKTSYPTTYPQPSSLQAKAKKLMQKAKKNVREINFKRVVALKFREYEQKLEALTNFNVSEAFEKAVQARVLTEIKKLLPTHIPTTLTNYVRPRLNTSVLEVMKNNQINLFTQSSTSANDLLEMDLKLKLLNRIHLNKSNENHTTHQQLYDTLYESIILDQEALDAQDTEPSFHKRSHDNQDPPNNREGENKNKRRKDVGEPCSRSSRQNKYPVVHAKVDTPAIQPLELEDEYIQTRPNLEWYTKSGSAAKKIKAIIQKDELTIADLEDVGLERLKHQYQNDVELEYHVDQLKAAVLTEAKWKSDEDEVSKPRSTEGSVYSDLRIKSVVCIVVKKKWGYGFLSSLVVMRFDDQEYDFSYTDLPRLSLNDVEDMYLLQVQDKLHHLPLEFVKDFNNENMIDMVKRNKLGTDNKRLKGRDWIDMDVEKSNEIVDKIDKTLKHREQLKRLEEYVGGRPKTVNPCTFVRPMLYLMRRSFGVLRSFMWTILG